MLVTGIHAVRLLEQCGGDKSTQNRDIAVAKRLAAGLDE